MEAYFWQIISIYLDLQQARVGGFVVVEVDMRVVTDRAIVSIKGIKQWPTKLTRTRLEAFEYSLQENQH